MGSHDREHEILAVEWKKGEEHPFPILIKKEQKVSSAIGINGLKLSNIPTLLRNGNFKTILDGT
jgi:hypothetical protein